MPWLNLTRFVAGKNGEQASNDGYIGRHGYRSEFGVELEKKGDEHCERDQFPQGVVEHFATYFRKVSYVTNYY